MRGQWCKQNFCQCFVQTFNVTEETAYWFESKEEKQGKWTNVISKKETGMYLFNCTITTYTDQDLKHHQWEWLTDGSWQSSGLRRLRTCWSFSESPFFLGINLNSFFSLGLTLSFKPFIWCSIQARVACTPSVSLNCTMAYTPCEVTEAQGQ